MQDIRYVHIRYKTCTLTPSLIESEGTPQQTDGPYFVDDMPNRSDIRSDPSALEVDPNNINALKHKGLALNIINRTK